MRLSFEKWHGCRNDFILVWLTPDEVVFDSLRRRAPTLCSRKGDGIGADGIIVLETRTSRDSEPSRVRIINSDGSVAATCGNGLRCAALSVLRRLRETNADLPEGVVLPLDQDEVACRYISPRSLRKDASHYPLVSISMGEARLDQDSGFWEQAQSEVKRVAQALSLPQLTRDFHAVAIGNHHLVFFLDDMSRDMLHRVGPTLQDSKHWDGINVHLAVAREPSDKDRQDAMRHVGRPLEELYEVLVWERGAGPTQACGSGACAVGAAAHASGILSREAWIGVDMPGGRLLVNQMEAAGTVELMGPAEWVFDGVLEF